VAFYDKRGRCPHAESVRPEARGAANTCIGVSLQAFRDSGDDLARVGGNARLSRALWDPEMPQQLRGGYPQVACEDAVISQEPHGTPNAYSSRPPAARLALVRICAHYFSHGAWLVEGALLRDAHRLAGIPGVLIHGRLDISSPLGTAWELARAWPDAQLIVIGDAGHTGSESLKDAILRTLNRFAR